MAQRRRPPTVDLDDYLRLVLHKTCWYTTIYPLRAGCLIGGRGAVPLGPLTTFGFLLGAAFQVRDDVLNLVGDPEAHGKDHLADLHGGQAHADARPPARRRRRPDERRWFDDYLARAARSTAPTLDVERVFDLLQAPRQRRDGDGMGRRARRRRPGRVPRRLRDAVSPFHAGFVEQLVDFVVTRSH